MSETKCLRCRNSGFGHPTNFNELVCLKEMPQFSTEKDVECDQFKSCYIEYPITVEGINNKEEGRALFKNNYGDLVKVAPCGEEYEGKIYLGILLGNMQLGQNVTYNPDTKFLTVTPHYNPAIFVPALKKIIWGCGSFWGKIKSEADLKDITTEEINDLWYVKLLKEGLGEKKDVA